MSKDRSQYLAAERHKTKVGKQRKADAELAAVARRVVRESLIERRPSVLRFHDLCEAVAAEHTK